MSNILQTLLTTYQQNPAAVYPPLLELFQAVEDGRVIEMPAKIGSTVWVSPNHGKSFHTGKLFGSNEDGTTFLVFVTDTERDLVEHPLGRCFYDWFSKIYTREAAEQALKECEK